MILTDTMAKKISRHGLWFYKTSKPLTDLSRIAYELSANGLPISIQTRCKKRIQQDIVAMVIQHYIDSASDENERFCREQEMNEYYTHGFFTHPEEMNDYIEDGPFWQYFVNFFEYNRLFIENCSHNVVLIEDNNLLNDYENLSGLVNTLPLLHKLALKNKKTIIVMLPTYESITTDFMEKHLLL